jgi:hypothetical protein
MKTTLSLKSIKKWPRKNSVAKRFSAPALSPKRVYKIQKMSNSVFILRQGYLSVRKGLLTLRRHITITNPQTIEEVQKVFEALFVKDLYSAIQNRSIPFLGQLAFHAAKGIPVIIISSNEYYEDPTFISLNYSLELREELEMEKPGCFEIVQDSQSISFKAQTSVDYQSLLGAIHSVLQNAYGQNTQTLHKADSTSEWLKTLPKVASNFNPVRDDSLELQNGVIPQ